jgi:ribonucleoside-diphosphate reductase alpha chain
MKANERFFKYDDLEEIKKLKKDIKKYGIRNSAITSIAPTGSISFLAETSGGMEPVFALVYSRKIEKLNKEYEVVYIVDPAFKEYLEEKFDENTMNRILKEIANNKGSCQKCKDIPDIDKKVFVVAGDLTPMEHLDMLEVVSRNVSLSVSKTINLKSDATKEEVSQVYLEAHKRGIIGVTVYRDGCRENILSTSSANEDKNSIVYRDSPKRPKQLPCDVYRITIKGEKYIAFIGLLEGKPYEVFCGKIDEINLSKHIKSGAVIKEASKQYSFSYEGEVLIKNVVKTFDNSEHEAFARMISTSLRHGTKLAFVIDQLSKSKGSIVDFSKAIIIALKKYLDEGEHAGKCPTCNSKLIYVEGCKSCSSCGYNACGG